MPILIRKCWILFLLLVLSSCSGEKAVQVPQYRIQSGSDLTLLTTSDSHYLSGSLTDQGPAFNRFLSTAEGKLLGYSKEIMDAFGYTIEMRRPDVVIISGDLTNNGEKRSHQDLADQLQAIEERTGTRVYVIPGNHDLENPWARKFKGGRQYPADSVTPKAFRRIYSALGYAEALLEDKGSLSYLAAPSEDLWLLMLDTSQSLDNRKLGHPQLDGRLAASTLHWIEECGKLAAINGAQIVAVMHHSLLNHSEFNQKGFTVNNNDEVIKALQRSGIKLVLSGHIHIQDISSVQQNADTVYNISSSALPVYPHQYGILQYSVKSGELSYSTSRVDMELWAAASGSSDPNLLDFSAYSKENFRKQSAERTYERLSRDKAYAGYTEEELAAMADVVVHLNELFLAGSEEIDISSILHSSGYQLWKESPPCKLRSYVLRITDRELKNNHQLRIDLTNP